MGKKKLNAYFFFMTEKRMEVPGWQNKPNQELMLLCSDMWKELLPEEKVKYDEMKKRNDATGGQESQQLDRKKGEVRGGGFDTHGRSLKDIKERDESQIRDAELKIVHTNRMVGEALIEKILEQKEFFIVEVNVFCETPEGEIVPAEISIAKFCLQDGVKKVLHKFIKPGKIPFGFTFTANKNLEQTHKIGLEQKDEFYMNYRPDELEKEIVYKRGKKLDDNERKTIRGAEANQHYKSICEEILKFMDLPVEDGGIEMTSSIKPALFTMPGSEGRCEMSLNWLFQQAKFGHIPWKGVTARNHPGHSPWTGYIPQWRLLEVPQLLYELSNTSAALHNHNVKNIQALALAEHYLEKDTFKFADGMSCAWHKENDEMLEGASGSDFCTSTAVRRWSFIMADNLCQQYGIKIRGGHHVPKEADFNRLTLADLEWENLPGMAIRPPMASMGERSKNSDIRFRKEEIVMPLKRDVTYRKEELKLPEMQNLPNAGQVFHSANTISEFMEDNTSTSGRSVGYYCSSASGITDFTDARSSMSVGKEEIYEKNYASILSPRGQTAPKPGAFRQNAAMAAILGNQEEKINIRISAGRGKNPSPKK